MPHYHYLLVGGGIAADAAARGIREVDADGTIGLIGCEPHPPYDRPPLSKECWRGSDLAAIWRHTSELNVALHLGVRAVGLDLRAKYVTDSAGTVFTFEKLLLATGGSPYTLPGSAEEVVYFRTLDDYTRLRARAREGGRFVVLGGGLIGPEIAVALRQHGRDVQMLFAEEGIAARMLPHAVTGKLTRSFRERGVQVWSGEMVTRVTTAEGHLKIVTRSGRALRADFVVAGLGIRPNTQLARPAGLLVRNGIPVDPMLRANPPDIFAAGDVACFHSPALNQWLRVEHEDAANTMGRHAGRGMAGELEPYRHLPYFYTEFFDVSIEAVGELDPKTMTTVVDWQDELRRGVIYYLREGRVRGVLLWNLRAKLKQARRLIEDAGPFAPQDLRGLISG